MARRVRPTPRPLLIAVLLPGLALAARPEPPTAIRAASAAEIVAALEPALEARLEEEKVVMLGSVRGEPEPDAATTYALVLFARPQSEVLRFLIQSARQKEYRPELRRAKTVEELEAGHVVEYEIRMMLMRIRYRIRHHWDFQRGRTCWSLDPDFDNDLAVMEGCWEVFPMGPDRTLGRVGTRLDVGHALPRFLQELATRKKLPDSMHRLRRWIDSGGTYRP